MLSDVFGDSTTLKCCIPYDIIDHIQFLREFDLLRYKCPIVHNDKPYSIHEADLLDLKRARRVAVLVPLARCLIQPFAKQVPQFLHVDVGWED